MGLRFAIVSFSQKLQDIFEIGFKKAWNDHRKIALGEKNTFGNKTLADIFLLFVCQCSYCPNLRAKKHIPSDM